MKLKVSKKNQKKIDKGKEIFRKKGSLSKAPFKPKMGRGAMLMYLQSEKIEVPSQCISDCQHVIVGYLKQCHSDTIYATDKVFGVLVDDTYSKEECVSIVKRVIKRSEDKIALQAKKVNRSEVLCRQYYKYYKKNPHKDLSNKDLFLAVYRAKQAGIKPRAIKSEGYAARIERLRASRARHATENIINKRNYDCALDDQARVLGCFGKEYNWVTKDPKTGEAIEHSGTFENLSRKRRKRIVHKAYKAAQITG